MEPEAARRRGVGKEDDGYQIGKNVIRTTTNIDPDLGLSQEVIEQLYLKENNIGAAIVLQSSLVLNWKEQLEAIKKK
jgi:hypothetical protein